MSNLTVVRSKSKNPSKQADCQPPNPYIMGGSTRIATIHIDTLELNLVFEHTEDLTVFKELFEAKKALQATTTDSEKLFEFCKGSQYFRFCIQRLGAKFYPYILKCGDVTLLLSDRNKHDSLPSARLKIGSISCQNGTSEVYSLVKRWLEICGLKIVSNTVARVDLCHDFNLDIKNVDLQLNNEDRIITKARSSAEYREHRKVTGLQYGRGDIVLRIYDKVTELEGSHNLHKKQFFFDKWEKLIQDGLRNRGEEVGDPLEGVTRVEFQLRGAVIKQFIKLGTYQELVKNIEQLWKYLTNDWFRHSSKNIDRENRNQDKAELSFFWATVQKLSSIKDEVIRKKKDLQFKSFKGLKDQVRGLFVSICAGMGHSADDFFGMMITARQLVENEFSALYEDYAGFKVDFEQRQLKYRLSF